MDYDVMRTIFLFVLFHITLYDGKGVVFRNTIHQDVFYRRIGLRQYAIDGTLKELTGIIGTGDDGKLYHGLNGVWDISLYNSIYLAATFCWE